MSALGQKRTSALVQSMSGLPPIADIGTKLRNVRFVPKADIRPSRPADQIGSQGVKDIALSANDPFQTSIRYAVAPALDGSPAFLTLSFSYDVPGLVVKRDRACPM